MLTQEELQEIDRRVSDVGQDIRCYRNCEIEDIRVSSDEFHQCEDLADEVAGSIESIVAYAEKSTVDIQMMVETINTLRTALEESVKLQSHYAKLLNMHDGGNRIPFENADQWIRRIAYCRTLK